MRGVMRIMKEVREDVMRVLRGETPTHTHLRDRLVVIVTLTVIVDLLASVAILFLERNEARSEITNFGDSIFWVSTQLLTVSSQLPNPISPGARVLDIFLQAWAISVVATLAGSFSAFFHRRSQEREEAAKHRSGGATQKPRTT
jgi:hypothetical protein